MRFIKKDTASQTAFELADSEDLSKKVFGYSLMCTVDSIGEIIYLKDESVDFPIGKKFNLEDLGFLNGYVLAILQAEDGKVTPTLSPAMVPLQTN